MCELKRKKKSESHDFVAPFGLRKCLRLDCQGQSGEGFTIEGVVLGSEGQVRREIWVPLRPTIVDDRRDQF